MATQLPEMLANAEMAGKVLLIDWRGPTAQEWTFSEEGVTMLEVPRDQIGEADLKFRAAILQGKSLAADAIDGDFVPIGLLAETAEPNVAVARLRIDGEVGVRTTEWVHIGLLREGMTRFCELRPLIALIALTGTDYSRNLPLVKPKKLWGIQGISSRLRDDFKDFADVEQAMNHLVAFIYRGLFRQHCRGDDLEGVMRSLHGSRLSARYKQARSR